VGNPFKITPSGLVEKQLATDKDFLTKLQKREKELPFDEKSTVFEIMNYSD